MRPNALVGFVAALFGGFYTIQAFRLPRPMAGNPPGPASFPIGLGILMTCLGILLVLREARHGLTNLEGTRRPHFPASTLRLVFKTAAAGLLYAFLLEPLGFFFSTLGFLGALSFLMNGRNAWKLNAALSLLFTFGAWIVFVRLFELSLP
jgi:putative tricarboxylic transport membrane protein